jgi:hypothetical protein
VLVLSPLVCFPSPACCSLTHSKLNVCFLRARAGGWTSSLCFTCARARERNKIITRTRAATELSFLHMCVCLKGAHTWDAAALAPSGVSVNNNSEGSAVELGQTENEKHNTPHRAQHICVPCDYIIHTHIYKYTTRGILFERLSCSATKIPAQTVFQTAHSTFIWKHMAHTNYILSNICTQSIPGRKITSVQQCICDLGWQECGKSLFLWRGEILSLRRRYLKKCESRGED